jgi:hypothetical protein
MAGMVAINLVKVAMESFPQLTQAGYSEDDTVEILVRGYLLASANFASASGWSEERICAYLDRLVQRIRSGEAQASAERFKADLARQQGGG